MTEARCTNVKIFTNYAYTSVMDEGRRTKDEGQIKLSRDHVQRNGDRVSSNMRLDIGGVKGIYILFY